MTQLNRNIAYKIATRQSWDDAARDGIFVGSEHDRRDGFIHLSTATQVRETAARHFRSQSDLILAAVDLRALSATVQWEQSRNGQLFPHIYGPLPMAAVLWTQPLPRGPSGEHVFPQEIA